MNKVSRRSYTTTRVYFDCSSPWTYLGFERIVSLRNRLDFDLVWKPILVGGVFNAVNETVYEQRANPNPIKARYHMKDLQDWARFVGITINWPKVFPVNSVKAMRGAIYADRCEALEPYARAVFQAYWSHGEDISHSESVGRCAEAAGLSAEDLLRASNADEIKAALRRNTDELISLGGFGSPTVFVGDEMYFGNDRMELIEAALTAPQPG